MNITLSNILPLIINMTVTASIATVVIMGIRELLKMMPKMFFHFLWLVVLFRLLCPVSLSSDFSLFTTIKTPVTSGDTNITAVEYIPISFIVTGDRELAPPVTPNDSIVNNNTVIENNGIPSGSASSPIQIFPWIWFAGFMVFMGYGIYSYTALKRRLVGSVRIKDNIFSTDRVTTPFVMGIVKPKIYLPSTLNEKEKQYIIFHEQHHIKRFDHIVKFLWYIALSIHWFNPFVWLAVKFSGKDMEMSCDEKVVTTLGDCIAADYSASLVNLSYGKNVVSAAPLAFGENDIKARVRNLAWFNTPHKSTLIKVGIFCIIMAVALMLNPKGKDIGQEIPNDFPLNNPDELLRTELNTLDNTIVKNEYNYYLWIDNDRLLVSASTSDDKKLYICDTRDSSLREIAVIDGSGTLSHIVQTDSGYNVSEFGGNIYKFDKEFNLLETIAPLKNANNFQVFADAVGATHYYYNRSTNVIRTKDEIIYDLGDNTNGVYHISISPDRSKLGFSLSDGEMSISKHISVDLSDGYVTETEVTNLGGAPYFLWIDNLPAYIDNESGDGIQIYFGKNLESTADIQRQGNTFFESHLYNLGVQNNMLYYVSALDNGTGANRILTFNLLTLQPDIAYIAAENDIIGLAMSPDTNKIAFTEFNFDNPSQRFFSVASLSGPVYITLSPEKVSMKDIPQWNESLSTNDILTIKGQIEGISAEDAGAYLNDELSKYCKTLDNTAFEGFKIEYDNSSLIKGKNAKPLSNMIFTVEITVGSPQIIGATEYAEEIENRVMDFLNSFTYVKLKAREVKVISYYTDGYKIHENHISFSNTNDMIYAQQPEYEFAAQTVAFDYYKQNRWFVLQKFGLQSGSALGENELYIEYYIEDGYYGSSISEIQKNITAKIEELNNSGSSIFEYLQSDTAFTDYLKLHNVKTVSINLISGNLDNGNLFFSFKDGVLQH